MTEEKQPPIEIPLTALSPDALDGMIDAFIMREGTDYGVNEIPHDSKVKQIRKQLEKGDVKIVFDPNTDSATLMTNRDWKLFNR
ncbi:MAG: YheU family protein [Bdellovibrionota bacterium]